VARHAYLSLLNTRILASAGMLVCVSAAAQTAVTLSDLSQRDPPDYVARLRGQKVIVRGTVNARAYHFPDYDILTVQNGAGAGALETMGADNRLDIFQPGDQVAASGTVSAVAGTITLLVDRINLLAHGPAPQPLALSIGGLTGKLQYLSRLVRVQGQVAAVADTMAGAYLNIRDSGADTYRVFLPRPQNEREPNLAGFRIGDRVEATGSAHLYQTRPPFNRGGFEMLANSDSSIIVLARPSLVPPWTLIVVLGLILAGAFLLWGREHRMRLGRERLRKTYHLGEEILSASSAAAILKRIEEALPRVLGVTRVRLYTHNRAMKTLDGVRGETGEPVSISLTTPPTGPQAGAVACFHYRTLLVIPDIDRSPFPMASKGSQKDGPKSLLLVPMMVQGEVIGVLELDQDDRVRDFSADEQALAQHLANQIGVALRLLDQRSVQEQLFRTEKLAAVGRLISEVVNELQTPLSSISDLARRALDRYHGPADRELSAISSEAQRAVSIMSRLVTFAAEQAEARPVAVGNLLRGLIEFRQGDWKASGIHLRDLTSAEALTVLGAQGQLEQVFLNLLVYAEQSLAEAPQKVISIRTSVLAKRLLVEVGFTAPPHSTNPEEVAAILGVTRSVIGGHGGEVRLIEKANADPRLEVELPLSPKERQAAAQAAVASTIVAAGSSTPPAVHASRLMTALVIDADDAAQRQLLALLSARGYRVVPVNNSDTGLELAQRMRFDAAFCSVHAPGLNWVELSERMHPRVGSFILISDHYDAELSNDFEGEGRFVLPKPFQESELERVLHAAEHPMAKVIPIKNGVA
jgi:GAF domain-containing protein/CheY-like chemotaxis protein